VHSLSRKLGLAAAALALACGNAKPCPSPLEVCGGVCVDLSSDPFHCGNCGNACGLSQVCRSAVCLDYAGAACANRSGGAFVVLGKCDQTAKIWTTQTAFITRAKQLLADPASPGASIPVMTLFEGSDCDGQWTWRVDPEQIRFDTAQPPSDCDACPRWIEDEKALRVTTIGVWCPLGVRILSVDEPPAR
jgi:hypothetical protein